MVDLDAVVSPDREVRMGGHTYRIPGSPPMEWYLWQRQFLKTLADGDVTDASVDEAYEKVLELIQIRAPKTTMLPGVSAEHCFRFLVAAYSTPEDEGPPTTRKTRGGTPPRARNGRRS